MRCLERGPNVDGRTPAQIKAPLISLLASGLTVCAAVFVWRRSPLVVAYGVAGSAAEAAEVAGAAVWAQKAAGRMAALAFGGAGALPLALGNAGCSGWAGWAWGRVRVWE